MAPLALNLDQLRLTVSAGAVALAGGLSEGLVADEIAAGSGVDYTGYVASDESTTVEDGTNNGRNQNKKRQNITELVDFSTGYIQGAGLSINQRTGASMGPLFMRDRVDNVYRPVLQAHNARQHAICELSNATYWNLNLVTAGQTGATAPNGDTSWRVTPDSGTASKWFSPLDSEYTRPPNAFNLFEYWSVYYVKYVGHQYIQLVGKNSNHDLQCYHTFDIQNGTTQSAGSHGTSVSEVSIGAVPNAAGWYRIGIRCPHDSSSFGYPSAYVCFVDGFASARGASTSSTGAVDVWRFHCYPEGYSDDALAEVVPPAIWDGTRQVEPLVMRNNDGSVMGVIASKQSDAGYASYACGQFTATNCTLTTQNDSTKVLDFGTTHAQMSTVVGSSAGGTGQVFIDWNNPSADALGNLNSTDVWGFSVFIKPGSQTWYKIALVANDGTSSWLDYYVYVNVVTGAIGTSYGCKAHVELCKAADTTTDLARVFVTFQDVFEDMGQLSSDWSTRIYAADADNDDVVALDGSVSFSVWGAMGHMFSDNANQGTNHAWIYPWFTGYSAASNITSLPELSIYIAGLNDATGSIYMRCNRIVQKYIHVGGAFMMAYTDSNDYYELFDGGGATIEGWHRIAGAAQIMDTGVSDSYGAATEIAAAYAWDANDMETVVNGSSATDTTGVPIAVNRVDFGIGNFASADMGFTFMIQEILFTTRRLSSGKMTNLTS